LLATLPAPDPEEETPRAPRVVAVLKQIGSKQAEAFLAYLADGKFGDVWKKAAKADSKR
jgi:hypothetical protein